MQIASFRPRLIVGTRVQKFGEDVHKRHAAGHTREGWPLTFRRIQQRSRERELRFRGHDWLIWDLCRYLQCAYDIDVFVHELTDFLKALRAQGYRAVDSTTIDADPYTRWLIDMDFDDFLPLVLEADARGRLSG